MPSAHLIAPTPAATAVMAGTASPVSPPAAGTVAVFEQLLESLQAATPQLAGAPVRLPKSPAQAPGVAPHAASPSAVLLAVPTTATRSGPLTTQAALPTSGDAQTTAEQPPQSGVTPLPPLPSPPLLPPPAVLTAAPRSGSPATKAAHPTIAEAQTNGEPPAQSGVIPALFSPPLPPQAVHPAIGNPGAASHSPTDPSGTTARADPMRSGRPPASATADTAPPLGAGSQDAPNSNLAAGATEQVTNHKFAARANPETATTPAQTTTTLAAPPDITSPPATLTLTPVAPAPPASASAIATPMAQLAPALLTMATAPDGNQLTTIRLHPQELGMVQVQIERAPSGATQVSITAEKPETLQTILRDQPQVHQLLNDAGIPAAGRTVTFQVAPPTQVQPTQSHTGASTTTGQGTGQQTPGGNGDPNSTGTRTGYHGQRPANSGNRSAALDTTPILTAQTYRIGLDITA